jgi:hypothetical protein
MNHAIIFIKLTNNEIDPNNGYIEKKYFKYDDISNNFINKIDTTANEMDCYKSTYEINNITPDINNTFNRLTLDKPTTTTTPTANILINNGGKIVVTSSKNDDQLILHYVSKMFGFEDIMKNLGDKNTVSRGGGGVDVDFEGGENNDFTQEELAEYQNQMEQQQQGGKKKRSKQNTKKRNQK